MSAIEWVKADDCPDDVAVADAVGEWLENNGRVVPAEFWDDVAAFEKPAGTSFQDFGGYEGEKLAQTVRVTMPLQDAVLTLHVGWDNVCGCGTCSGRPTYEVIQ